MTSVELIKILRKFSAEYGKRMFRLRELAVFAGESSASAGMALIRNTKAGMVARAGTLWINMLEPPTLEYLALALNPLSYISFESALYKKGVLSQSPRGALTLATLGRPAHVKTPLGDILFTHISRPLFFGFDEKRLALPEKAFLDMVYIRVRKGTFKEMTEVLYPEVLDKRVLQKFARRFPSYVQAVLAEVELRP